MLTNDGKIPSIFAKSNSYWETLILIPSKADSK